MRDLAVDVVSNVGLRDTMCAGPSDPGHNGSKAAKEITIVGSQGTSGEGKFGGAIVREEGIRVLQECDQY